MGGSSSGVSGVGCSSSGVPGLNEAIGSIGEGVFFTDMMAEILQGGEVEEVVANYHDQFVQIYQDFGLDGE